MAELWQMFLCVYTSDDTKQYNKGVSSANINPGGFPLSGVGSAANYPRGWTMRHVYGVTSAGDSRHSLPCASRDNSLFVNGGTFSTPYITGSPGWNVDGKIGEKRANKV